MTLSMSAAQFLRSAHQSWSFGGAFKGARIYRVSGLFRGSLHPKICRTPDRRMSGSGRVKRPLG
jgi:hypothetical protein